ncbi:MAG: hypothetical protein FWH01_17755 [Oscillospiraceae bacterium]|nr:hypothetical protein [Oscillospiraceae bacterium]
MLEIEKLWETLLAVLVSVVLGVAKVFTVKGGKRLAAGWVIGQLVISGAAGLLMTLFARGALKLGGDLLGFTAGVAGWGGSLVIDALYKKSMKDNGLNEEKKKEENE